jgi:putative peptide zinc metalloprotease protein
MAAKTDVDDRMAAELILPVRMRGDLVIVPYRSRHGRWWTVKDPLALRYFWIRDEELFVLRRLDGRTAAMTILSDFQQHFAPHRLAIEELMLFIQRLAAQRLVTIDAPARADAKDGQQRLRTSGRRWARLANPLAIQWRGVDPQGFLNWIYSFLWWVFSPWSLAAALALIVAALALIIGHWDEFQTRLPATSGVLAPTSLLWIGVAIAVLKVLHEIGHALTCRHLGGECHELGLMLLCFVPCLYCNVSDAWLFPGKWQRIAVSGAGICVELFTAAVCVFLWWYSEPGPFNSLCFSIMLVASTGTLLLNGNPLLRYDGYYVFADLIEVPNLRRRSIAAFQRGCFRWLFGIDEPDGETFGGRWKWPFVLFGFASLVYSWLVMFVILWFIDGALGPYGLRPLAAALALLVVGSRLTATSFGASRRVAAWNEAGQLRPFRFLFGCAIVAAIAAGILMAPLPHRVAAPGVVTPRDAEPVYVITPGRMLPGDEGTPVQYGDRVSAGQVIARLENHAIEREISRLQGELNQQKIVAEGLRRQHSGATEMAAQLSSTRARIADLEHQLEQRQRDRDSLVLRASREGVLLVPSVEAAPPADPLLPQGPPLDPRSNGRYLPAGTLIGLVGTPGQFDALLVVDQVDIPFVRKGQPVRIQLAELGETILTGTVAEVATRSLEISPSPLVATQRLPSQVAESGKIQPLRTTYEVRVEFSDVPGFLAVDAAGDARIDVGTMTLARRFLRWFDATFARDR